MDMAREFPHASVIGIDLNPASPTFVSPANRLQGPRKLTPDVNFFFSLFSHCPANCRYERGCNIECNNVELIKLLF